MKAEETIDKVEEIVKNNLVKLDLLEKSILENAFRGKF